MHRDDDPQKEVVFTKDEVFSELQKFGTNYFENKKALDTDYSRWTSFSHHNNTEKTWLTGKWSRESVRKAIARISRHKSPGISGHQADLLKDMDDEVIDLIYDILTRSIEAKNFPTSWDVTRIILLLKPGESPSLIGKRRPISLQEQVFKILNIVMNEALNDYVDINLDNLQAGFRPNRTATEQATALISTIEHAKKTQTDLYILYIDFSGAFDTVEFGLIWAAMRSYGVPEDLIGLFKHFYDRAQGVYSTAFGDSPAFKFKRCTAQGAPSSPTIFNTVISLLINRIKAEVNGYSFRPGSTNPGLGFADDLCQFVSPSRVLTK